MLVDLKEVMEFLPHRDPFLFIDGVSEVSCSVEGPSTIKDLVGSTVVAHYRTKKEHEIFKGHFPGNPILPGVVQVEMMAQASGFIAKALHPDLSEVTLDVALVSVTSAKFRKPVLPEMDLVIKTTCDKIRGVMMTSSCEIYHDGVLMSEASVMASLRIMKD
jgi:3-hydroxyacyl-[acyl-carrier-protein] dehydratase